MTVTAAEGTDSSAELETVAQGVIDRATGKKPWTMLDLATMLAKPAPEFTGDTLPTAPAQVKFTDVLRKALKALPDLFGKVMPDEVRALDRHELKDLTDEDNAIVVIQAELAKRREAIKEAIRNHQDKAAEAAGLPEGTQRVAEGAAKGHWLLASAGEPHRTPVDGYADCWQQQLVKGKVDVSGGDIFRLAKEGLVTHAELLRCTSFVGRAFDEDKMNAFIRRDPERGLRILAMLTTRSAPSASLVSPKK